MFLAMNEQHELINAKEATRNQKFYCPACKQSVQLKRGRHKIAHFAHLQNQACDSFSEGETLEHLHAKELLFNWLKKQNYPVELEAYLPNLKQRPDLLVAHLAIEMQCSPLTISRFIERNQGYLSHHYFPWWLIGSKLQPKKHQFRSLVKSMICYHPLADFYFYGFDEKQQAIIYYGNICWHYRKGYYYQAYLFPLQSCSLTTVQLFCPKKLAPFTWKEIEYRFYLQHQLVNQRPYFISLQEFCYLHHQNLLNLPAWCYQASCYQVLFGHDLLILRMLYLQSVNFKQWLQLLKSFPFTWEYIFLNQSNVLVSIYKECKKLNEKNQGLAK